MLPMDKICYCKTSIMLVVTKCLLANNCGFYILKISYFCNKISTGIFSQLNIIVNILVY